jgi:hypothetical protein
MNRYAYNVREIRVQYFLKSCSHTSGCFVRWHCGRKPTRKYPDHVAVNNPMTRENESNQQRLSSAKCKHLGPLALFSGLNWRIRHDSHPLNLSGLDPLGKATSLNLQHLRHFPASSGLFTFPPPVKSNSWQVMLTDKSIITVASCDI